jgi:CRISPR-associated endonuclease/helicase Cas3
LNTQALPELVASVYGGSAPIPFQQRVFDAITAGQSVVLQAPTGSGKTFAALAPFVLGRWGVANGLPAQKLIYSLPLRVLAGSLRGQYQELFRKIGLQVSFTTQYSGSTEDPFLDGGDVVFTTIDQTLSGFIGTPLSLPNRLANVLYGSVLSGALVFDEFHLLEPEKSLTTTLHLLKKSPWPVLIMTATMSTVLRQELSRFLNALEIVVGEEDIPRIRSQHETTKHITVESAPLNGRALAGHLGTRTLVICNTVKRAQTVYEDLRDELDRRGDTRRRMLLHSRFLPEHRRTKEERLREWFGEGASTHAVLVATQVIEAGLDISCDVMHTEISPIDSFLQRIGRAARFGGEREAHIHVYPLEAMEAERDFRPYSKGTTLATLTHLREHRGLRYEHLQQLIDEILTEQQEDLVRQVEDAEAEFEREIHRVRRTLDRPANKDLIREVDNAEVIVAEPNEVLRQDISPYAYPAVSVPRTTLFGFFHDGGRAHVVQEYTDESGQEVNGRYYTVAPLDPHQQWPSLRLVISPEHADYNDEIGLRLGRAGTAFFTPNGEAEVRSRTDYPYKEPYREHIERVYEHGEARQGPLAALHRLSALGKLPVEVKDPERVIDFVIWAHDLAKLADGWQRAHGDYDLKGGEPLAHGGRERRPPPHAAESAYAAYKLLARLFNHAGEPMETWACAVWAIRTHHSPLTEAVGPYRIRPARQEYLRRITPHLRPAIASDLLSAWNEIQWSATADDTPWWRDADKLDGRHDPLYALLVYMLRRSDQLATAEISSKEEIVRPQLKASSNII